MNHKKIGNTFDKSFYITMLVLALPIALQNLITSLLNMVDSIMIGRLGEVEAAAAGLAMQQFFIFMMFTFGVCSGATIFIAQFWGARNIDGIYRTIGLSLIGSSFFALIFFVISAFFPEWALRLFAPNEPEVIRIGADYLRVVSVSYLFTAISQPYLTAFRATEQPRIPLIASCISLVVNTCINYVLIFGKLGFPALGVKGAAIATVIARGLELAIVFGILGRGKNVVAAPFYKLFHHLGGFWRQFIRVTVPVVLNEGLWGLGASMYSVVFGHMGTVVVAASNVVTTTQNLVTVFFAGLASAAAIMVGKKLGEHEPDEAYQYAKKLGLLSFFLGIAAGVGLILLGPVIVRFYNFSDVVNQCILDMLGVIGLFCCFKMFNYVNIVGILRSGGDAKFTMYLDVGSIWLIGVPLVYLAGLVLSLPIRWVAFALVSEEFFKGFVGIIRLKSKKWVNTIEEQRAA